MQAIMYLLHICLIIPTILIILTTVFIIQIKISTKNNDKNRKTEIMMNIQKSKKKVH